jgi:hypothetical protein
MPQLRDRQTPVARNALSERVRVDVCEPEHNRRREDEDRDVTGRMWIRPRTGHENGERDDRPVDEAA